MKRAIDHQQLYNLTYQARELMRCTASAGSVTPGALDRRGWRRVLKLYAIVDVFVSGFDAER
jgi:hypothetical protein